MGLVETIRKIAGWGRSDSAESDPRYTTELEIIHGIHCNDNTHKSIIHFSFNKAATLYTKSILIQCAMANGMTPVGINDYAFNSKFPFLDKLTAKEMEKYQHIFRPEGYLYSVFGGMVEGIPFDPYKIILAVRDPRDLLVSEYYSTAFSHPLPDAKGNKYDKFMENRNDALTSTIDEYVVSVSNRLNNTFLRYNDLLIKNYPGIKVIKYEDMLDNFQIWFDELLEFCELPISQELYKRIIDDNLSKRTDKEDIYRHLRKGKSGDHKEKLKPETIDALNQTFSLMLKTFRYEV